jgi:hypothetical protein
MKNKLHNLLSAAILLVVVIAMLAFLDAFSTAPWRYVFWGLLGTLAFLGLMCVYRARAIAKLSKPLPSSFERTAQNSHGAAVDDVLARAAIFRWNSMVLQRDTSKGWDKKHLAFAIASGLVFLAWTVAPEAMTGLVLSGVTEPLLSPLRTILVVLTNVAPVLLAVDVGIAASLWYYGGTSCMDFGSEADQRLYESILFAHEKALKFSPQFQRVQFAFQRKEKLLLSEAHLEMFSRVR